MQAAAWKAGQKQQARSFLELQTSLTDARKMTRVK
jgi:hypothetical protein